MSPLPLRSVVIGSVAVVSALIALIFAFPRQARKPTLEPISVAAAPAAPASKIGDRTETAANAPAFAAWNQAADNFLKQTWRTSRLSPIGSHARIDVAIPATTGSFDQLVEALPSAEFWPQLPILTRARLQSALPKTTAEALAWTDQRLLHLWALVLNLPRTRDELRSTLDDLRTVRWLADQHLFSITPDHDLDGEFSARLSNLEQALRAKTEPEPTERKAVDVWREAIRQARQTPRQRLTEAVGLDMYSRLRAVTRSSRFSQLAAHVLPFYSGSNGPSSNAISDPTAAALYAYGPLPAAANAALGIEAPGASDEQVTRVPELVPQMSDPDALRVVDDAFAARVRLDWTDAPQTLVLAARGLAEGRIKASAQVTHDFLEPLLTTWPAWPQPITTRAEAGLALLEKLSADAKHHSDFNEAEETASSHQQKRALCLIALGRGREADALLGENDLANWEPLDALSINAAPGVADFLLSYLPRHDGVSLRWWELMVTAATEVGRGPEALAQLKAARSEQIYGSTEILLVKANQDAGQFETAAELLLTITARAYESEGMSPSQRRADALWQLLELGEAHHRAEWTREAVKRFSALMTYWLTERDNSSDGGDPWDKWPGRLADLGRLDLALSAAQLNVRWRSANGAMGDAFLMPAAERKNYVVNGPAAALAGWAQVLALQKMPQAVIDLLITNDAWPARDLSEIASSSDASFAPARRQPLAAIVADALVSLGRKSEAARVRSSISPGWEQQLKAFLTNPEQPGIAPAKRVALEYVLTNEVPDGVTLDLVAIARALEEVPFAADANNFPQSVFPLTAAAERLNHDFTLGEAVTSPPILSLRTYVVSSSTDLAPVRDALLANIPGAP